MLIGIKNEDWTKPGVKTARFWSRHILWAKPTIKESIDDMNKKFKSLNVKMKLTYFVILIYSNVHITIKYNSIYL